MIQKYSPCISMIRVLAMLSIIIGHWFTMQGINHFQYGAIGVEIFLIISGWLYGNKKIEDYKSFWWNRWKKIVLPFWLSLFFVIILRSILSCQINWKSLWMYFLNLQGINKVLYCVSLHGIPGIGQTWFLTVLMICYALMILLKQKKEVEDFIDEHLGICACASIFAQMALVSVGIQIVRILCFFYGYFFLKKINITRKKYVFLSCSMVIINGVRLLGYIFIGDSVVYEQILFCWTFVFTAFWLVATAILVYEKREKVVKKVIGCKLWKLLDRLSYPMFLTHYMFMRERLAINVWVENIGLQIVLLILLTMISAILIVTITDRFWIREIIKK